MKRYFCVILILSPLFLQGCNKTEDSIVGIGEIHYDGHVYQLNNVTKTTSKGGHVAIIDNFVLHHYTHELHFSSTDGKNSVNVKIGHSQKIPVTDENALIGSKTIELFSGDCFVYSVDINVFENSIQSVINLKLADDDDDENLWISPKMNLVYAKRGDIFEIELKYSRSESDFFVNWESPLKEIK